jgi:hypothetical protein
MEARVEFESEGPHAIALRGIVRGGEGFLTGSGGAVNVGCARPFYRLSGGFAAALCNPSLSVWGDWFVGQLGRAAFR